MAAPLITGGVIRDKRFLRWVGETLEFRWLLNKDPETWTNQNTRRLCGSIPKTGPVSKFAICVNSSGKDVTRSHISRAQIAHLLTGPALEQPRLKTIDERYEAPLGT
ncbi:UNVERIFIED_CONTAM: hypothetical protein FKN15_004649 [Acipenser sinensis]